MYSVYQKKKKKPKETKIYLLSRRALVLIVINPNPKYLSKRGLCKFSSNKNYLTFLMTFLNGEFL